MCARIKNDKYPTRMKIRKYIKYKKYIKKLYNKKYEMIFIHREKQRSNVLFKFVARNKRKD